MSSRTIFLSKLLGLYCLFVSLAMLAHKQATLNTVNLAVRDAPLMLILGVFALASASPSFLFTMCGLAGRCPSLSLWLAG